jgi:hypothetical protein
MKSALLTLLPFAEGHGMITWPPARNNGSLANAGYAPNKEAFWFSQPAVITESPTLPAHARTMNVGVNDGPGDFTRTHPWRAPGTAPVFGSGCGMAGGGPQVPTRKDTGGFPPPDYNYGDDFLKIPPRPNSTVWARGTTQEVAWAAMANHGGGYSWRLCKNVPGGVNEACFQQVLPLSLYLYQPFAPC